jgi:hypothetical protein
MEIKNKKIHFFLSMVLILFLPSLRVACAESSDVVRLKLAVFPFNDMETKTLDTNIPVVLKSKLAEYEYLEIIPVETITRKVYEIEPSFLWTGKEGSEKKGGILWTIQPRIVEEVNKDISADMSVYGDMTRYGDRWRIDARIVEDGNQEPLKVFTITGLRNEKIPGKLTELAGMIADSLKSKIVLHEAEEYIRRYMGGIYTYALTQEKIKGLVNSFPGSVPLRALLLDLYLKQKDKYAEEILREGLGIIEIYSPERGDDTRYLLSLNIDPFHAAAEIYEERQDWEHAIGIRENALKIFPYRDEMHKNGLGRDYYFSGVSLENTGQKTKALEKYKISLLYLKPSSEYFQKAEDRIKRLNEQ